MQRSRRVWGRLVRAEYGQILRLRSRPLVGPGGPNVPSLPGPRLVRRAVFLLLLMGVLVGAQARAAVAQPAPDPHPTSRESPKAPAPDPAPDPAPTRTAPSQVTPDAAASSTSSSSSSVQPRTTTPAPTSTPTFKPPRTTTTPKTRASTAEQKTRATRPGRPETVAAAGKRNRQRVPLVAAVTDRANGRELLLGGLGLLALALASGSLLFLVSRTGVQAARP